jgi:ABC-2 family transporter protein
MIASFFRIVALVRKELLAMLKDPRARAVLFVPPALQCLVFGYVVNYDLNRVSYAVFDRDRSAASYELLAALDGSGVFQRVANLERVADVKTEIDDRRALVVVQIDQDFERRLLAGRSANVQVIADGRNSNTAGTALNYVGTVVDSFNADWWTAHGGGGPPIKVSSRVWYNSNLETRRSILPSLVGTLTLAEVLLMTAMSIARENTLSSRRDYDWKGTPVTARRTQPIFGNSAGRSTLVSNSFRRFLPDALRGPDPVSSGCVWHRAPAFVAGRDHATGTPHILSRGDAVHSPIGLVHLAE